MESLLTLLSAYFMNGWFFIAGLGAASAPTIIHLLNRRRFRTMQWAAMDFLREALQRNRRIMQLRDLILLLIRTFAILLIGLALAWPIISPGNWMFWAFAFPALLAGVFFAVVAAALWAHAGLRWFSMIAAICLFAFAGWAVYRQQLLDPTSAGGFDGTQPLHAVLLIDNSLSMGYETALEGSLLEMSQRRAAEYIEELPSGSRVSLIPICGATTPMSIDPYTKDDALAALENIETVDRSVSLGSAISQAKEAMDAGPMMSRRVVFIGDQQAANWRDVTADQLDEITPLQVVQVSEDRPENSWIEGFFLQDGLADVQTPATFVGQIRHTGGSKEVELTLNVDEADVAAKTVTLQGGAGAREVTFQYVFHTQEVQPGKPLMTPVTLRLSGDSLAADDERSLVVPVVASLPVVFIDQYGAAREDLDRRRVGETRPLRRLLALGAGRSERLIEIRHVTVRQVNREMLSDARLVVIAGVADPSDAAELLREYVQQGGQLVIAAGGDFDPAAWQQVAWKDGAGILPTPLATAPLGETPDEAVQLQPFFLSYDSLSWHPYFQLADVSESELRDLYAEPIFFKAVKCLTSKEDTSALVELERTRLLKRFENRPNAAVPSAKNGQPENEPEASTAKNWLAWESPTEKLEPRSEQDVERLAELATPRVLAKFDEFEQAPFMIERRIDRGRVLMVASGLQSNWNTLAGSNAILMFDRILRSMIQETLPQRTLSPRSRVPLPFPSGESFVNASLTRPGEEASQPLDIGFVGADRKGVAVDAPLARGVYRVSARKSSDALEAGENSWEMFAMNGPSTESELAVLTEDQFAERITNPKVSWVGPGEEISLAGETQYAQSLWWWLLLAAIGLLSLELIMLAWPRFRARFASSEATATLTS